MAELITPNDLEEKAIELIAIYHIKTIQGKNIDDDEVLVWYDEYYHIDGLLFLDSLLKKQHFIKDIKILDKAGEPVLNEDDEPLIKHIDIPYRNSQVIQIISYIRGKTRNYDRYTFKTAANRVNINNGILDYSSDKIKFIPRTTPDEFYNDNYNYKLNLTYDPTAKCPTIDKIIEDILIDVDIAKYELKVSLKAPQPFIEYEEPLYHDIEEPFVQEPDDINLIPIEQSIESSKKQKIVLLDEIFGFLLNINDYRWKKAFIFVGENHTGKNTILNMMLQFLGRRNTCSVPLSDLDTTKNRFAGAKLVGKMANLADETGSFTPNNVNVFMSITGGGQIPVEDKNASGYDTDIYAKMIFTANDLPALSNANKQRVYDRFIMIECLNQFRSGDIKYNSKLKNFVYSEQEMSGLLNRAIVGFNKLLKDDNFAYDGDLTRTIWESHLQPVNIIEEFLTNNYTITTDDKYFVPIRVLHVGYQLYCMKKHQKVLPINAFSTAIANAGIIIKVKDDQIESLKQNKRIQSKSVCGLKPICFIVTPETETIKTPEDENIMANFINQGVK